jgi:peptide/nickel transport system substrate-binding protein
MRLVFALIFLLVACSPSAPGSTTPADSIDGQLPPQKDIVIGFVNEPNQLEPTFGVGGGNADFSNLLSAFLAYLTPQQQPMPYLAAELPDLQRGTWKLFPDGRMETTYKLNSKATWHDGSPVTAQDFVFAYTVRTDPALGVNYANVEKRIGAARALDDSTLFLEWPAPYIYAGMIPPQFFAPLPSHLLADLYATGDKSSFREGPYWREQFIGSGPYRLESWQPGVELVARAHPGFVFGKPPVDRIIFKFMGDGTSIVANLLAGSLDAAFHNSIGFEESQELRHAGWNGTYEYWRGNPRFMQFQQRDWGNLVPAVLDARIRRALLHAIDRSAIVDGLYEGTAKVQHFWLDPSDPAFPAVNGAVTKYEYDPARAQVLLQEAGWTKGSDGFVRNSRGEILHLGP